MFLPKNNRGFTLIEILVVIAIIGILASIILVSLQKAKDKALDSKNLARMKSFHNALELYLSDHGYYPPDENRDIPPGVEQYLNTENWPQAPWPDSVYDWENWGPGDLTHPPHEQVYQLSVRFCDMGDPSSCNFPDEDWASGFMVNSAAYWCIKGPCRSHSNEPTTYPGHCLNCD